MAILLPAYGRDYKTAEEAKKDWFKGKDFIFNDLGSRYNGAYCSIRDFSEGEFELRFNKMQEFTMVTVV